MNRGTFLILVSACFLIPHLSKAEFVINLNQSQFNLTGTYNEVTEFSFEITMSGSPTAGSIYDSDDVVSIDYRIRGVLAQPTPSGFPGFELVRSVTGAQFRALSEESTVDFQISSTADLSDGLQLSELEGSTAIFSMDLREFNQRPGRYHPPIFVLNSNGTGSFQNSNNKSNIPNPDPPLGSGLLVDVDYGEEYSIALTFTPASLTLVTVEPSFLDIVPSGTEVNLTWDLGSAATIDLERSSNQVQWTKVLTATTETSYSDETSVGKMFYRLVAD